MAAKKKKSSTSAWLLFWLAFIIAVTLLFVINRKKIEESLAVLKGLFSDTKTEAPAEGGKPETNVVTAVDTRQDKPPQSPQQPAAGQQAPKPDKPAETKPAQPAAPAKPAEPVKPATGQPAAAQPAAKTVTRQVYMIRLDNDGSVVASKTARSLPSSDSPMQDAVEAVIRGVTADEEKKGLLSLMPKNVKILSATVQGSTAYINFSEDFMYNTYGIEGYAGQLRQIVWTATEFSNVKDVQILIDGKRVDYLGEGIWMGSPLSRDSF